VDAEMQWGNLLVQHRGKHKYKVPSAFGVKVTRSIEGSIGVLIVSFLAAFLALLFSSYGLWTSLYVGFACGLGGALVEVSEYSRI